MRRWDEPPTRVSGPIGRRTARGVALAAVLMVAGGALASRAGGSGTPAPATMDAAQVEGVGGPGAKGRSTDVERRPLLRGVRGGSVEPGRIAGAGDSAKGTAGEGAGDKGLTSVVVPLALVIGLACLCAAVLRRAMAAQGGLSGPARAPAGILEVLGRYPLSRGQGLVLLRVDRRVLLLSQQAGLRGVGPGLATLAEFTDPEDVASILAKVQDAEGQSAAARFRALLQAAERGEVEAEVPMVEEAVLRFPDDPRPMAEAGGMGAAAVRRPADAVSALRERIARMGGNVGASGRQAGGKEDAA